MTSISDLGRRATWLISQDLTDRHLRSIVRTHAGVFVSPAALARHLQCHVETFVDNEISLPLIVSYAREFVAQVDWEELAKQALHRHPQLAARTVF